MSEKQTVTAEEVGTISLEEKVKRTTSPRGGLPTGLPGAGRATPFTGGGGLPGPAAAGLPGRPGSGGPDLDDDEEFTEDFTDVTAGLVPEGMFPVVVTDLQKTQSKANKDQYEWDFKIVATQEKGRGLKEWTSLSPNARWKIVEHLEALGFRASGQLVKFRRSEIVGRVAIAEVYHDEYNGKTNSKIRRLYPATSEAMKQAEEYLKEKSGTPDV